MRPNDDVCRVIFSDCYIFSIFILTVITKEDQSRHLAGTIIKNKVTMEKLKFILVGFICMFALSVNGQQVWLEERYTSTIKNKGEENAFYLVPIEGFQESNGKLYMQTFAGKCVPVPFSTKRHKKYGRALKDVYLQFNLMWFPKQLVSHYRKSTFYVNKLSNAIEVHVVTPTGTEHYQYVTCAGENIWSAKNKLQSGLLKKHFEKKMSHATSQSVCEIPPIPNKECAWLEERYVKEIKLNGVDNFLHLIPIAGFERSKGLLKVKVTGNNSVPIRSDHYDPMNGHEISNFSQLLNSEFTPLPVKAYYHDAVAYYKIEGNDIVVRIVKPHGEEAHRFVSCDGSKIHTAIHLLWENCLLKKYQMSNKREK